MHAAVGWAALCASGEVSEVNIQPVGEQLYEVALVFADGRSLMVRVRLIVWAGQVVRTVVEHRGMIVLLIVCGPAHVAVNGRKSVIHVIS